MAPPPTEAAAIPLPMPDALLAAICAVDAAGCKTWVTGLVLAATSARFAVYATFPTLAEFLATVLVFAAFVASFPRLVRIVDDITYLSMYYQNFTGRRYQPGL